MSFRKEASTACLVGLVLVLAACGRDTGRPGGVMNIGDPDESAHPRLQISDSTEDSFQNGDNFRPYQKQNYHMDIYRKFRNINRTLKNPWSPYDPYIYDPSNDPFQWDELVGRIG